MNNEGIEFQRSLVLELEDGLKGVESLNSIAISESEFKRDFFPTFYEIVTKPNAESRRWVELTGNMYARVNVVSDDGTKLLYNIPPVLGQGHTASPDPESMSLNDLLDHAALGRDTLPEIAITAKHNAYSHHADVEEMNNYEKSRIDASKTVEVINKILTDYGYEKIPVPVGLESETVVTAEEKKPAAPILEIDNYDDGEML